MTEIDKYIKELESNGFRKYSGSDKCCFQLNNCHELLLDWDGLHYFIKNNSFYKRELTKTSRPYVNMRVYTDSILNAIEQYKSFCDFYAFNFGIL